MPVPIDARAARVAAAALALAAAAGCAQFSQDGGLEPSVRVARERFDAELVRAGSDEDRQRIAALVDELLARPLDAQSAVRIALLNSPGLQAAYAQLGIAEADLVQAGRLRNPTLAWMDVDNAAGDRKNERVLLFDLWGLLLMPLATEVEARRFEAAKNAVAGEVARTALAARAAFFDAVGAAQQARYLEDVVEAAGASRDLALRMARVGNWPQLNLAREQLFYADAAAQLARAQQQAVAARERLVRVLGLWGARAELRLPDRLPDLPESVASAEGLESTAIRQRFDIAQARAAVDGTARALGLTRATRFLSLLEVGPAWVREGDHDWMRGYEIELSVPLFDWGGAKVAKAEAIWMQSVNRLAQVAVDARSEVRESYHAMRTAHELARHYRDEIVPLRKRISDEQLKRYNGMLIGVFDLIADARDQVSSVNAYIGTLRDFWLADTRMQAAMLGAGPVGASPAAMVAMPAAGGRDAGH